MTVPIGSVPGSPTPPMGTRSRWFLVHALLAVIGIAAVSGSLAIGVGVRRESMEASRHAHGRVELRGRLERLGAIAGVANAPGNDVFVSHDARSERRRLDSALVRYGAEHAVIGAHLLRIGSTTERESLIRGLARVDGAMHRMTSLTRVVLDHADRSERDAAGHAMVAMDRELASLNDAIRSMLRTLSDAGAQEFQQQFALFDALQRYELIAALGAFLMLYVIVAYHGRVSRTAAASLAENVRHLAALQRSEERFRELAAVLEIRVDERTQELAGVNSRLAASEGELRALIGAMSDVVIVLDADGTYRKVFETNTNSLIRPPAELVGRNIDEVLPPLGRQYVREKIDEALAAAAAVPLEYSLPLDGRMLWFRGVATRIAEGEVLWMARDVTERKLAEDELRRREQQLTESQRIAHVGSWDSDLVSGELRWSEQTCRIFGLDPAETVPSTEGYMGLVHPDDRERMQRVIAEAIATSSGYSSEHRIVRPDGETRVVMSEVHFVVEDGTPVRAMGVIHDVTERTATREALAAQQAFLRQVIDTIPSLVFAKDREGCFTLVNQAVADVYGVPIDEIIGRTDADLGCDAEEATAFRLADLAVIDSREQLLIPEERITDASGQTRWLQTVKRPILDVPGGGDQLLGVSTDITQRKAFEERVRERETQLAEAQRLAGLGSWQQDLVTGTLAWSAETYRQVGFEPDAVVPSFELFLAAVHADDRDSLLAETRHTIETGEPLDRESRFQYADGSIRHFQSRAELTRAADGRPLLLAGTSLDVTEQAHTREALRAARIAAEAASQAKSDFLANVSHEIRTPMNGVLGMLELALDDELAPEQRDYLETAHASAESLLRVISDILDFSKVEAGQLQLEPMPFWLDDGIADALGALPLQALQKGLELAVQIDPGTPLALVGDENRLRQVIVNLIGNAIKFTSAGEVVLRVAVDARDERTALLHFRVSDTGVGIPREKQQTIFEAFQQADTSTTREFGGTGLGLAIVARLVALMGGRVWVESEPGSGSTFHFTARFATPADAPARPTRGPTPADMRGMRVLVVDDNATHRQIVEQTLREWDMQPTPAADGPEALALVDRADQQGSPFAVVLVDADMPHMNGFALVERLRQRPTGSCGTAMMLSAARYREEVDRCRALGVVGYVTKPVRDLPLWNAIRDAARTDGHTAAHAAGSARAERRTHVPRAQLTPLRILVAEDNRINQKLARKLLEHAGHVVVVVENGREAVEATARERFDVVLMDVQMPEMGGFEATAAIRAREVGTARRLPIIAVTARAMTGDREACLAAGMDAYLSKPIRSEALHTVIEETVRGGQVSTNAPRPDVVADDSVLDETGLLGLVSGDRALMGELAHLFAEDCPAAVDRIRAALGASDTRALEVAAHALKGAAVTILAHDVATATLRLEEMGRGNDLSEATYAMARLDEALDSLRPRIAALTPT